MYSDYLGGSAFDQPEGAAVDAAGRVYITGYTTSTNFPSTIGFTQLPAMHSRHRYFPEYDSLFCFPGKPCPVPPNKGIVGHELGHGIGLGHIGSAAIALLENNLGTVDTPQVLDLELLNLIYP